MNIEHKPIVCHTWVRSHQGNKNFLVIEEVIWYKFDHKTGIELRHNSKRDLATHELGFQEKALSFNYLKEDAMSPTNVATKDYKYFLIKFVNGAQIICTNYKEFEQILNDKGKP